MSIAFRSLATAQSSSGATSCNMPRPTGVQVNDFLIVVIGFEGVSTSGPWTTFGSGSNPDAGPNTGWMRTVVQAPSATGNGMEVWTAIHGAGTNAVFNFNGTYAFSAISGAYSGAYVAGSSSLIFNGTVRSSASAQWTGNNPEAPSVATFANDLLIVCGSDQLDASGWTPPTGFTERDDQKRGGTTGNVEVTFADQLQTVDHVTGTIPFTATATTSTTKGTTATLSIRAAASTQPVSSVRFPAINYRFKPA